MSELTKKEASGGLLNLDKSRKNRKPARFVRIPQEQLLFFRMFRMEKLVQG